MELGQIPLALSLVRNIMTYRLPVVYHWHLKGPVDEAANFPLSFPSPLLPPCLPHSFCLLTHLRARSAALKRTLR